MSTATDKPVTSLDNDQLQKIFVELDKKLCISVDINSLEPHGLQFWTTFEADLVKSLGIRSMEDTEQGRKNLSLVLEGVIDEQQVQIPSSGFSNLLNRIVDHYFGFGLIDELLRDESIFALTVNGFQEVYFESRGRLQRSPFSFQSDAHFKHVIDRLCVRNNSDLPSEEKPIRTFSLPGNLQVIVLVPPVTPDAPCLSISSRFAKNPITIDQVIQFGTLSVEMLEFLNISIGARLNILVCGHLGSGANTFVNILSSFIPGDERVISIEYENEYALRTKHLIKLLAKDDRMAENSFSRLLTVAGKMRGDRLVLGDFLPSDAYNALTSINDDFSGSIIRITAKSPADAANRLETFLQLDRPSLPIMKIRHLIASSIDLIVYLERLRDGSRAVKNIVEVLDELDNNDELALKEIFGMEETGSENGRIHRKFVSSDHPSKAFTDKVGMLGYQISSDLFMTDANVDGDKGIRVLRPPKGNYVFISYSSKDLRRVLSLAEELEKHNFYVWLDKWYLEPGKDWSKGLEKAIKDAGVFIVVLTSNSVDSEIVISEILTAKEAGLPIIPVKMGECSVPIPIKYLQYIQLDQHNVPATLHRITDTLSQHISNQRLLIEK